MDRADTALAGLLDEVQETIRRGNFTGLAELTARMVVAETALRGLAPDELARIRRLAERNARTLVAARRGIRAARRRIDEVMSAARGLVTYDRSGHRVEENDARGMARRF
jgi:hypothetical protein